MNFDVQIFSVNQPSFNEVCNSKIQLQISLEQWNNNKSIRYFVRTKDLTTNEKKVIVQGTFGDWDGGWANGDSIPVAFARVGSEFWFCVAGAPGLVKIQSFDQVAAYDGPPTVFAVAKGTGRNSISGTVSDIYIINE